MAKLHIGDDLKNLIINLIKKTVLDIYFPVGTIYLSTNTTNPGNTFGGTWVLESNDSYLHCYNPDNAWFNNLGINNTGSNGDNGSFNTNDTALTVDQIPSHTHGSKNLTGNWRSNKARFPGSCDWSGIVSAWKETQSTYWSSTGGKDYNVVGFSINASHEHSSVGGNQGHNHFYVPPFFVVAVWRRTA